MTEEEFEALLKLKGANYKLVVNPQVMWEVSLIDSEFGTTSMARWACSSDKELALDQLAEKFFEGDSADTRE